MDSNWTVIEEWIKTHYSRILAIALPCLLLLFAVWAFGGFESQAAYRDAVRAVIAQDKALSLDTQNRATVWELIVGLQAEKLDAVVSGMKTIDLGRCPKDFRRAYQSHIQAWADYAIASRSQGNTSFALKNVESTWHAVHSVAQQYGVDDAIR